VSREAVVKIVGSIAVFKVVLSFFGVYYHVSV